MQLGRCLTLIWFFTLGNSAHAQTRASYMPSASKNAPVTVQVLFNAKNMPSNMELYEVPTSKILDVTTHATVSLKDPLPFTVRLANEFPVQRGETKYFAMVVRNNSDQTQYFYASYHQMRPEEAAIGYLLNCLCINRLFSIPPRSAWYRIGSIMLTSTFIGSVVAVKHDLFGMSLADVQKKKAESLMADK